MRIKLDRAFALLSAGTLHPPGALPRNPQELTIFYYPNLSGLVGFEIGPEGPPVAKNVGPLPSTKDHQVLGEHLLAPFSKSLAKAKRLRVITYGTLKDVDFHALSFKAAPLISSHEVLYPLDLPSAKLTHPTSKLALIVGDPTQDLSASRVEASSIATYLRSQGRPTETLLGSQASGPRLIEALSGAHLFHYAGHGKFGGLGGWDSALPLADHTSLRDALYAAHPIDRGSVKKKLGKLLASKFPSQLRQAQTWRAEAQTAGAQEPSSTDTFLPTTTSQTMVQTELMEMGPDGPQKLAQDTMLVTRHVPPPEVAYAPATSTQSGASFSGTPPPGYAVSTRRGLWLGVLALTAGTAVLIALFIIQLNDQPGEVRIPTKRSVQPRIAATPSIRPMIKQVEEPTTPPPAKPPTKISKGKRRPKTTPTKRAPQTAKVASPSQSRLQARLRKLRRQFNNSGTFEITELVTLLKDAGNQVDRLDPAQRSAPKRLLAQAQSCVSTCTDSEQMLNVAAKLLGSLKP